MHPRVVNVSTTAFDVFIGRPSDWGNPFSHRHDTLASPRLGNRAEAIARYREWILDRPEIVARCRRELRGKVLGCYCAPQSCHGDVLAEIANQELEEI